ncbi:MAG: tetratricopeptide repeat protein [Treponema sp.]|nr:tetratricopeptide repeat protein [Treponema sp.]
MKSLYKKVFPALLISALAGLAACSTQPKNPSDVYDLQRQAETQIELAGRQADRGNYETSLVLLNEAMRLAVSLDNSSLRIRAGLSRGNVLFALNRSAEAFGDWERAGDEAEKNGGGEMLAVSRVYLARGRLLSGEDPGLAQSVREEVVREMANIKADRLDIAFSWIVIGLSEKALGRYSQAEAALMRSLDIHEKGRHLEQAAYDWFLVASFRSLSGDYEGARRALESALVFDRRVENSYGLASDWRALGDVYKKAGSSGESREAYQRSAEIFRSIGNDEAAAEALGRAE